MFEMFLASIFSIAEFAAAEPPCSDIRCVQRVDHSSCREGTMFLLV